MLLSVKGLKKNFGGIMALNNVDLKVEGPSIVSIIGPNGAGKTTLFNCITGIHRPDGGKVFFGGQEITFLPPHDIVKRGIVRTFQNLRLFGDMNVLENVLVGMHTSLRAGLWGSILRSKGQREEEEGAYKRAKELLKYVGLWGKEHLPAKALPYGEQRKLEIARALAASPKLLLLDEPTAGMNPAESKEVAEFLKKIQREFDMGILLIEHDMRVVMEISQDIVVLDLGSVIATGKAEQIRSDKKVIKAYLGSSWQEGI